MVILFNQLYDNNHMLSVGFDRHYSTKNTFNDNTFAWLSSVLYDPRRDTLAVMIKTPATE